MLPYKSRIRNLLKLIANGSKKKVNIDIREDDVFLVSFPRSGNTWVRFLLANLLAYDDEKTIDFYSVHDYVPDMEIREHRERINGLKEPRIIKSHSMHDSRFKRVIYILRDGRDVMVSYYNYLRNKGTFDGDFIAFLRKDDLKPCRWHEHVDGWLQADDVNEMIIVKYEDLIENPIKGVAAMAEFVGIPVGKDSIQKAISNSTFHEMRKAEVEKGRPYAEPGKDFQFIRKGVSGDWINYFNDEHKKIFKGYANDTLKRHGYVKDDNW